MVQPALETVRPNARVAVIRLRSLGDCVLTTPALALLKAARPDLSIGVVVEDRFAAIFEDNPDVSAILPPSIAAVARWRAELCVNLHGGSRSLVLTAASRARCRAGFAHFRHSAVYNVRIPTAQEILQIDRKVHTAEHLASAMFHLGVPVARVPRARLYAERRPVAAPYAVIHPFAATAEKTWPAERFLQAAEHIERQRGLEPVFLAGPGEDPVGFSRYRVVASPTLREAKSILAGASLFLGNDSGPAHMAAAFGVPVVVLFGPSDPVVWAPWQVEAGVVAEPAGIGGIATEAVIDALNRLKTGRSVPKVAR